MDNNANVNPVEEAGVIADLEVGPALGLWQSRAPPANPLHVRKYPGRATVSRPSTPLATMTSSLALALDLF